MMDDDKSYREFRERVALLGIDLWAAYGIADTLERLAFDRAHIRRIVALLREKNVEAAVWLSQQEADKNTAALTSFFRKVFGCRLHAVKDCTAPFCHQKEQP